MTSRTKSPTGPQSPLLHMRGATLALPGGRVLFEGLSLSLSREHVALVGRNGVGKSTLLAALSGAVPHERVRRAGRSHFVPQALVPVAASTPCSRRVARPRMRRDSPPSAALRGSRRRCQSAPRTS